MHSLFSHPKDRHLVKFVVLVAYNIVRDYMFAMLSHDIKDDKKQGRELKLSESYVKEAILEVKGGVSPICRLCRCGQDAFVGWSVPHIFQIHANIHKALRERVLISRAMKHGAVGYNPFSIPCDKCIRTSLDEVLVYEYGGYYSKLIQECESYCSSLLVNSKY